MPLYTKGPVTNEQKDALDYDAPFGEYMGAMVEQGLRDLPTAQSQRVVQVEEADAPARPTIDDAFILAADPAAGFDTPTLIDRARQLRREDPASQAARMSKPDALAKAKAAGVDINVPDRGLTPFAVDLLINEAKERNRRALIMERHQAGWGSVAGWGAYFGVQLLDPVNIGTAFVPVIGEARYADILRRSSQLAGGVGRTGARLGVGAAEGVVGSLLVEPMIYSNEQVLNADYGMADSLLNIAFGGVLGGGLHAVGGGVADLYRARTGAAQPWAAPQVLEDVLAQEPVAPTTTMVTGRAGDVRIGDEYVPSQWAVVDAGDIRATMEKADNQFRDRGRVSSDEQIREIANNIDFRMLGESPVMDYGSPTLSRDGRIIGGNGRMAAIDMAYDIGKGGQYREAMLEVLDQLGIDAEAVRRMKKPALVRVLQKDVNVREAAILSNEGGAMRMSALEQAKVDAERMGDFRAFEVADDGNLATAGNRGFIRQWVDKYPKNQRNALVDADGMLSAEGLRRLQNGILFRAYGDSPTLTRLIEATDPGSRNIASAMTRAAAVAADARAEIAAGNMWDVDIADDLRAAVEKMDDLRRRGMSVQEFFDQMDAFGSGLTPEAEALLRYIGENIRSPRALAAVVSRYYDLLRQAGGPNQGDMFGGGAPVKGDLLEAAMRDARAVTTAADVAEAATPQQRRAAMQASVAQAATGRSVEVVPIMAGGSRQDFMGAAERLDSPESIRVADFDAAAEVDQRAGQKSDVETALDEAMALAKDAAAGAKFSRGDAAQTGGNWFYSPAMRALEGMKQAKATAQQWISMLTKAPGVKKEEIEWTGVVDWLNGQKGSVSRDDVAAYLERTQVKLEEVTKGGEASADLRNLPFQAVEVDGEWNVRSPNGGLEYRHGSGLTRDQAEEHAYDYSAGYLRRRGGSLPQMPDGYVVRRVTEDDVGDLATSADVGRWGLAVGGDDWVSDLIQPFRADSYAAAVLDAMSTLREMGEGMEDADLVTAVKIPPSMPRWSSLTLPGGKNYTELLLKLNVPESARPFIHNAHWDDQQNVLVHIRFDEFEHGGKRYLRVFEVQSDWHQAGRRKGYNKPWTEEAIAKFTVEDGGGGYWDVFDGEGNLLASPPKSLNDSAEKALEIVVRSARRGDLGGLDIVPDAPFKTSWPELTLKRVIALAAERGLDGVLWPDAALVPEIEKWGKTLDQIKSSPDDSKKFGAILDRYEVTLPRIAKDLTKKFGGKVGEVRVDNSQGRSLVDIAKEHSLEIWKSGDEIKFYSGVDVVDYDDLPRPVMRALDKLLENVADGDLSGVDIYAAIDWQDVATAERWHAVELDDRLRETVAGGLPLFARGDGDAAATPRDAVLATARQSFGDATDDLVAAGRIEVVDTVEDLPIPVPADVKGVELGGRVYLVASNLRPDEVRGVVLHEVGVHSGMRGLLGDDVFKQVLADVDARVAAGDKAFVEARERAIAYSNKPEHVREETVAYLVQNAPKLSWVQELLARLKAALYRVTRGKLFDLDEADLQMLAVAALRKAANDERVARMDAAAAFARGEAYHGSPYRFSKFSLEHMGRGEGAQAYGWGLYFAGKREVAEFYRSTTSQARVSGDVARKALGKYGEDDDIVADVVRSAILNPKDYNKAARDITYRNTAARHNVPVEVLADAVKQTVEAGKGQLYKVEIPEDSEMLLWDKPLSEQPKKVRDALRKLDWMDESVFEQYTGQQMYEGQVRDATMFEGRDKGNARRETSGALLKAGVRGIKYLDGMSRDSGKGSFNYVIFDDAAIDIVETYYSRGGEQQKPAAPGDLNAELKPFDEAIKRAELYGTAVRAAAERLGDDEAARAAMATATGDKLLAAEVDDLLAMLKKENARVRASLRKARDQFTAEDAADALQDDAMRAAETVANNVKLAAEIEKRNAALNIAAKMRGIQFAQQFADKREGFMALLSGSAVAKNGSRLSAQAEQKAFLGRWTGGMVADLEKAGLWKLFVSDTMSRETMQALSALTSGVEPDAGLPKQAVAMARVVHKYLEDSRLVRNRFGAWIRDLRGYTVRQSHDMFKIRKAGYQAWRDFVLPRLDVERTLREFPDADVERFLQGAYNDFAAGIHMEYLKPEDVAPFKGPGNLAKRQSQSRVIYLKDAAAEHAYLEQFGVGRFSEAILQQLTAAANSAGMLKVLGTNPEANLEAMMDAVESQMVADPVARQKFHEQRKQILSLLGYLDGKANIPGNAMAARISANLRAWQSMAKLGGALLSSITDLAVYASEVKYQGRGGYLSGMSEAIGGLVQGRRGAERRQMLMSMGVFFDSMVGEVNRRFDADDLMGGTSSWLMQKFFKWNGLQWWTESLRMSSALSFSSHLADTAGKSWAKLGPDFQRVLGLYRIDEGKWDVLRMATLREADGRRYLTPDGLDAVPDAALENYLVQAGRTVTPASLTNLRDDLRQALRAMIIDRGEHAIIEPDARTRWWLLRGQPPGTVWGETARFIAQFKGFPVAVLQRTLGREVYGRGSETLSQALRNGNGEMLGLVQLLAWMTLMGYGAMTAKDLLKGKAPRPVDDHRTWMAAMLQGGAAGIYGDFLFGEMRNRFGSGLLSTVAGPVIGTASDVADLWGRVRAGDDAAARAFRLLLQNTPFMNLFYTRIAMDYLFLYNLQEQMNPGYLRRMERRAEQENGQQWLLRPSEAAL